MGKEHNRPTLVIDFILEQITKTDITQLKENEPNHEKNLTPQELIESPPHPPNDISPQKHCSPKPHSVQRRPPYLHTSPKVQGLGQIHRT